jgi:ribosomal protein L11
MKKHFFIIALVGFITLNFSALKAQEQPDRKPRQEQVETLTTKQIKTVNKILADYNSESLSANDAKALMKEIKEAKIPGGKGVEKAITDAGFDFEKIRELAPPPARPNKRR